MKLSEWQRLEKYWHDFPKKLTCKYCNDVRYYSHICFYEDRCPKCGSIAFDCRKVETVERSEVPAGIEIRSAWA